MTCQRYNVRLNSGPCSAMREHTQTLWSSNPNASWETIQSLIPPTYASVLDDGKEQFGCQDDGTDDATPAADVQASHSRLAKLWDDMLASCPESTRTGLFFAQSSLWLMCAQSLAAFDISKHVENGAEVTPEFKQVGGTFLSVFYRSLHGSVYR